MVADVSELDPGYLKSRPDEFDPGASATPVPTPISKVKPGRFDDTSTAEPVKTPSQRAAELNVQILEHQIERWPEEDRLRRESQERQAETERQQAEYNKRAADEQIKDIQEQRQFRKEHPRPVPPTVPPAPQFHLTPPPGLFGHNDAPGNQWMDALTLVGAMGSGTDRRSAMTAMVAMTGMLEGWAKGQKQVFDEKYNAWKDSVGAIEKNYQRQTEYYNNILGDNKMSMEEKKQELALGAVAFKDAITYELAVQGRLDQTDKLWKERADTVEKLAKAEKDVDKSVSSAIEADPGIIAAASRYAHGYDAQPGPRYRSGSVQQQAVANVAARMMQEEGITDADRLRMFQTNVIGGGVTARAGPAVETAELRRVENLLTTLRPFEEFTKGQLANLAELAGRVSRKFGIPVADALIRHGEAALRDDPDAALFIAQLSPTTNEIERIITTNAATNTLSVFAQKSGEKLINAGYSAATIRALHALFDNDFARREATLIKEANRHRVALGLPPEPEPDIPPLPPAGGGGTAAPRKLPPGFSIEIR